MVDRKDVASWLEGPQASRASDDTSYPGSRLGLPREGPGSVGRFGRRAIALLIDWVLCQLIATALLGYRFGDGGGRGFLPLLVLVAENVLLVGTVGFTVGHRLLGLRVAGLAPRPPTGELVPAGPLAAVIRTLLLALAIPALVWDRDERGLHDKAAGTVVVRR